MIRLDTVKLMVPQEAVTDFVPGLFREIIETPCSGEKVLWYQQEQGLPYGVKGITWKDSIYVECSGKVLKGEYFELINRNTIEQVLAGINEGAGIKLSPSVVLDRAVVLRCDSTVNLKVDREIPDYIRALSTIRNTRFRSENYRQESIVFSGRQKYSKPRMIFYEKYPELLRDKPLLAIVDPSRFRGVLRSECNIRSFKHLREAFCRPGKEGEVFLREVLESEKHPNYQFFRKVRQPIPELFNEYPREVHGKEIENLEGRKSIIKQLNYDPELIKLWLLDRFPRSSAYRREPEYKSLLDGMLREKEGKGEQVPEGYLLLLDEIEELLRIA